MRETWRAYGDSIAEKDSLSTCTGPKDLEFRADFTDAFDLSVRSPWRPSIMPRWASRLTLEITSIRVERVQDITEADAIAEGMIFTPRDKVSPGKVGPIGEEAKPYYIQPCQWSWRENATSDQSLGTARYAFANLWQHINGEASWAANPWVWVVSFKRAAGGVSHA